MVMPGDNLKCTVELIAPIAMETGLRFAIREGGRTVGAGVVSKIVAPGVTAGGNLLVGIGTCTSVVTGVTTATDDDQTQISYRDIARRMEEKLISSNAIGSEYISLEQIFSICEERFSEETILAISFLCGRRKPLIKAFGLYHDETGKAYLLPEHQFDQAITEDRFSHPVTSETVFSASEVIQVVYGATSMNHHGSGVMH